KDKIIIYSNKGFYKSTNFGENWEKINNTLDSIQFINFVISDSIIFGSTNNGKILSSSDFGVNWQTKFYNKQDTIINCLHSDGTDLLFSTNKNGIYQSSNLGNTWTKLGLDSNNILNITSSNNYIFASSMDHLYISIDKGKNWTSKKIIMSKSNLPTTIKFNNNKLYITLKNDGIYNSNDLGDSWNIFGFNYINIYSVLRVSDIILAGTNHGVMIFKLNGITLNLIENALNDKFIRSLSFNDKYFFAGTWGSGLFRAKLSDFGIVDVKDEKLSHLITSFLIIPNPATDYVQLIGYNELQSLSQKVEIFSVLGYKVAEAEPSARIDVSGFSPGIYFLKAGNKFCKFVKI
ncbi:MAG: T9SS type A sorting domain-containing protein, partial [Bacteroidota bacterium]